MDHPTNKYFVIKKYKQVRLEEYVIKYFDAPDIKERIDEIIYLLRFKHIETNRIFCIRSHGSKAKKTIARIHGLGRIWQRAMGVEPAYIIEVLSEKFDRLSKKRQDETLIHELLHVSHNFHGGFRYHKNYVTEENVQIWYKRFLEKVRDN
jgi:predicted metallopeptidase